MNGFDSGPGNCLIDNAAKVLFGTDYDPNGSYADKGVTNRGFLRKFIDQKEAVKNYRMFLLEIHLIILTAKADTLKIFCT